MALSNSVGESSHKRPWLVETEDTEDDKTVASSSSSQDEGIQPQKRLRTVVNTSDEPVEARKLSTEGSDSGFNGLEPDELQETDVMNNSQDSTEADPDSSTADHPELPSMRRDSDSSCSEISDISGMSSEGWRPMTGAMMRVQALMASGVHPREVLAKMLPRSTVIPSDIDEMMLWRAIIDIMTEPARRKKLPNVNTMEDVIHLIKNSKKIMVLTGAGVSVSCGIPDFRSKDGIYSRLAVEYPDLPNPQAMFDIQYFRRNQGPFFKFAKEIYPGQFEPSIAHKFVRLVETHEQLLRNYTQNIDTLEQVAHIENVIQCHGSFATATCMVCKYKTDADGVKEDIMNQVVPRCPRCPADESLAIMKPDIVFFGESLPEEFHRQMEQDKDQCDLLIVMGSSLKVRPVALIPNSLPAHVPQILINREPLRHLTFDVELLGNCDVIVNELCNRLGEGWNTICTSLGTSLEISREEMETPVHSSGENSTPDHQTQRSNVPGSESESAAAEVTSSVSENLDTTCSEQRQIFPEARSSCHAEPTSPTKESVEQSPDGGDRAGSVISVVKKETTGVGTYEDTQTNASCSSTTKACPVMTVACQREKESGSNTSGASVHSTDSSGQIEDSGRDFCVSNAGQPVDSSELGEGQDEKSERELEMLRASWQPRRINIASRIPDGSFLFLSPNRYVFPGAEVYDENTDSSSSSNSSVSSPGSPSRDAEAAPEPVESTSAPDPDTCDGDGGSSPRTHEAQQSEAFVDSSSHFVPQEQDSGMECEQSTATNRTDKMEPK